MKTFTQVMLVIFEISGVGIATVFICNIISPATNFIDHMSRFFIGSSIYELLIFCTFSQITDTKKDALLSLKTMYKYADLYFEMKDDKAKEDILGMIESQLDTRVFNHVDIRMMYKELKEAIRTDNSSFVKKRLIYIEHYYEEQDLKWKHSVILNLLK